MDRFNCTKLQISFWVIRYSIYSRHRANHASCIIVETPTKTKESTKELNNLHLFDSRQTSRHSLNSEEIQIREQSDQGWGNLPQVIIENQVVAPLSSNRTHNIFIIQRRLKPPLTISSIKDSKETHWRRKLLCFNWSTARNTRYWN